MAPTVKKIRQGLADTIADNVEATVYTFSRITGDGYLPAVLIEPDKSQFDLSFNRGTDVWEFKLHVLVKYTDEALAQDVLDDFITGEGPNSIRQAIDEHDTLGVDGVFSARVYEVEGYGNTGKWAGIDCIRAVLKVRVMVDNSD